MPDQTATATAPGTGTGTAITAGTATATRAVRFGYHGSRDVARHLIRLAGWAESAVRLTEYNIADPFRGVREGDLDLMTVKFWLREPDLACSRVLAEDPRAVVVAADHPLAAHASVSIEDVARYDAFDRPGNLPGYVWDEVVPPRTPGGRTVRRTHRVTAVPEMMRLVGEGRAVHVSLLSLRDIAPPGIRVIPVHDLPPAPVTLAWRRGGVLPAHVREFVSAVEAAATR